MSKLKKERVISQKRQAHRQAVIRLGKVYRRLLAHTPQKTNKSIVQEEKK
jgi:hypothetical protein